MVGFFSWSQTSETKDVEAAVSEEGLHMVGGVGIHWGILNDVNNDVISAVFLVLISHSNQLSQKQWSQR